jgi:predicted heme/steroid binding protein
MSVHTELKKFTAEDLSAFDGSDGGPEYIAIKGVVYDITRVNLLKGGKHHGILADKDVTDRFVHKDDILKRVPIVGQLV